MGGKRRESGLRALRRGAALGLALTALWIFGLTADLSGAWDALGRLGQTPSFVLGALAITRPVFIAAVLTQFVGASLLVEGVLDLVSFLTLNKLIKKFRREMENHSRQ